MLKSLARRFRQSKKVAIIIHQKPDGDAIGSAAALKQALEQKGKDVRVICSTPIHDVFLSVTGKFDCASSLPSDVDLIVTLDCSQLHRTGIARQLVKRKSTPVVVIDHHPIGDLQKIATHYWCETSAAATAELVWELLNELRVIVSPSIATALLMAIYTDTGAFQHTTTSRRSLEIAARLIRHGADLQKIVQAFLRTFTPSKKRLWGKVIAATDVRAFGIVTAVISQHDLAETKSCEEDTNGLANVLALAHEAKAALVLTETSEGWRGVLRTRHAHVNLRRLAALLGGKGQKKAAGFLATNGLFSGKIKK